MDPGRRGVRALGTLGDSRRSSNSSCLENLIPWPQRGFGPEIFVRAQRSPRASSADRVSSELHMLSCAHTDEATGDAYELLSNLHLRRASYYRPWLTLRRGATVVSRMYR